MTSTVQKTNAKKDTRITCTAKGCSKRFTPSRRGVKFCSDTCRTSCNNARKARTTETTIPRSNHFCQTLITEALRAGTLEVFTHLKGNVAALEATYKVVTARMRANIKAGVNSYHVCHVAPVMHPTRLGTFDATNLFVGAAEKNKAAATVATGSGTFIAKAKLNPVNDVADTAGRAETLDRIIAYIGEATFKAFVKKVKLKDSVRVETLAKLEALVEVGNPEHSKYVVLMLNKKSTTQELTSALAELSGKTPFKPSFSRVSEANMLVTEYVRHAAFREELAFLLPHIAVAVLPYAKVHLVVTLDDDSVQTLFDLLQGFDAGAMEAAVGELIYALHAQERQAAAKQQRQEEFDALYTINDGGFAPTLIDAPVYLYPSCRTLEEYPSDLSYLNPPF